MKKAPFFILVALLFLSCHKNKNDSCNGSFVTMWDPYIGPPCLELVAINVNTGELETTNPSLYAVGTNCGRNAYDSRRNYYYVYANNYSLSGGSSTIYLQRFDLSNANSSAIFPSSMCDTIGGWSQDLLLCNSTANKLYLIDHGRPSDRIYEINMNGTFSEKEIFSVDTTIAVITTPVIDENTGDLYFFSAPNLIKVNPATGTSSIVNTYTNVVPCFLQYVPSDGMFYGANEYASPYTFIKIDPQSGNVTTLAQATYFTPGTMIQTFDYCNNQYILEGGSSTYWIDPFNGEVVKQSNVEIGGTYVNAILP